MTAHTRQPSFLLLVIFVAGPPAARAGAQPSAPGPAADRLARPLDLSIQDARLSQAVEALNATEWVKARCEGQAPDRKVTLILDAMPLRNVLDALAALYGVQLEEREETVVLSPRKPGASRAAKDSLPWCT